MNRRTFLASAGAVASLPFLGCGDGNRRQILNASYDATRELYRKLNRLFSEQFAAEHPGEQIRVTPSHGGSGSQARAVIDGLPADVVTLALFPDTDAIRKKDLIAKDWIKRFPHNSCPYTSTIVFAVRKGNPFGIRDWDDLTRGDNLQIVAANPKTSGAAKLGVIAAWGSVRAAGGSVEDADALVTGIYRRVPALESSARGATVTFARKLIGDVHLTWENEAWLELRELKGEIELVYPKRSIRAEPHVTVVDANVDRNGTRAIAEAYVRFLYSPVAQQVIAENYLRPTEVQPTNGTAFGAVECFGVNDVLPGGWDEAQKRFFADGALFDRVYRTA